MENPSVKLTSQERRALDRIRDRLDAQGFQISDEKFILALLKAASQLPEEELVRLISEGLQGSKANRDPKRR